MELDVTTALILAAVGVVAGIVNTMAGGGSLLTLPALIFFGLPPGVANATNRVSVLLQSGVSSWTLFRSEANASREDAAPSSRAPLAPRVASTVVGAAAGAGLATLLDAATFRMVIGAALLGMAVLLAFNPKRFLEPKPPQGPLAVGLGFFVIGVYGGFLQAGVGIFLLAGGTLLAGEDLVRANATKNLLVFLFTLPALAVFVTQGMVQLPAGLALAAGSTLGGWVGAHLTLRGGAPVIRWLMLAAVVAGAIRLLTTG